MVGSVAAVALASLLYATASDWEKRVPHVALRFACIAAARLLIVAAVKLSAALVAAIANSYPDDALNGALDASGAFLTWASAVFTRFYYEALKMTLVAVGFYHHGAVWDIDLRRYLSPLRVRGAGRAMLEDEWRREERRLSQARSDGEDIDDDDEEDPASEERHAFFAPPSLPFSKRFAGGRIDRKLLMLVALMYMVSELSALTSSLLQLVGYLTQRNAFVFADAETAGQCGIRSGDAPVLVGLAAMQVIYYLAQQPSLVPLLIFAARSPPTERGVRNRVVRGLRKVAVVVLLVWALSLLCLPLFVKPLEPFFVVGDISLFWYVVLAPPAYHAVHYRISAAYTIIAVGIAFFILYGLSKDVKGRQKPAGQTKRSEGGELTAEEEL